MKIRLFNLFFVSSFCVFYVIWVFLICKFKLKTIQNNNIFNNKNYIQVLLYSNNKPYLNCIIYNNNL